jgi:polar amino acid transport system substrate-binding protein
VPSRHLFALRLVLLIAGLVFGGSLAVAQPAPRVTGFRLSAPYVMQQADGTLTGLEYDLVMLAAGTGGLLLRPQPAPYGRLPEDFRRQAIDAFVPANAAMALPGCLSDTVLIYRNMAFTLQRRGLAIVRPADLAGLDVTGFQNAHVTLGPEVAALQGNPARYREVANQMLQVRALFAGRTDVVLAERRILRHLMRSPDIGVDVTAPLAEHDIFPPTPYGVAFQRSEDCLAFNRGLAAIRRSGVYDEVLRRWDSLPQAKSGDGARTAVPFG